MNQIINDSLNSENCSICLEPFLNLNIVKLSCCHHIFHLSCIIEFLNHDYQINKKCPICRNDLNYQIRKPFNTTA